jgi:hypothetical protein
MGGLDGFLSTFNVGGHDSDPTLNEAPVLQSPPGALDNFLGLFGGAEMESHWFYDKKYELKFDKSEWAWFLVEELGNLTRLYGVTKTCHIIDRSQALIPWTAKVTIEKLLRIVPTYTPEGGVLTLMPMTFEDFSKIALEAKKAHSEKLEEAGDIGHMAHTWLEYYIKAILESDHDKQRIMLSEMCKDPRATSCCNAALDWMKKHNVRWLETEGKIFSKKYMYAGTTDGLCMVDSCDDPTCCATPFKDRLTIADWKSSNYLYIEYLFQTAAYEHAKEEEFGIDIQDRWILRLGKEDGEFEPWHLTAADFQEDFDGFLACLNLLKLTTSVNDRMKVQKKAIREAKKAAKAAAKEIAKAAEKLAKAEAKAKLKLERAEEKARIKAEAKAAREAAKKAKLEGKLESETTEVVPVDESVRSVPQDSPEVSASQPVVEAGPYGLLLENSSPWEEPPVTRKPFVILEEG